MQYMSAECLNALHVITKLKIRSFGHMSKLDLPHVPLAQLWANISLIKYLAFSCSSDILESNFTLNPIPYGLFNKPNLMGGRSAPPSYMTIRGYFLYSFLTWVFSWM